MRLFGQSLLLVQGAGSKQFLQGLLTKDMEALNSMPLIYAFLLNVKGRILADIFVYRLGDLGGERFVLETGQERIRALEKALKLYRLRRKIEIEPLPNRTVCFSKTSQANIAQKNSEATGSLPDPRVARFGFRSIRDADEPDMANGSSEASSDEYLRHRLEWGLGESEEMADQIPLNVNGDLTQGISYEKGCYIGQELVARTQHTGIVRRRLMPFKPIDYNGNATLAKGEYLRDARGKRQGKVLSSYGSIGGLCLASLDIVPRPGQGSVRLFDSTGHAVEVHRPQWWPSID